MDPADLPLRDIHLPAAIGWWPPAPGWWILLALAVILIVYMIAVLRRRARTAPSSATQAGQMLQVIRSEYKRTGDDMILVRAVSELTRRWCISVFPATETASLSGEDWLLFLDHCVAADQHLGDAKPFSAGAGRVLATGPYQRRADIDGEALLSLCERLFTSVASRSGTGGRGTE